MKPLVVTIGREFGSAGKDIGLALADRLGIPCYDKELLERAAQDSEFCEEIFEHNDEKPSNSFLYSFVVGCTNPMIFAWRVCPCRPAGCFAKPYTASPIRGCCIWAIWTRIW